MYAKNLDKKKKKVKYENEVGTFLREASEQRLPPEKLLQNTILALPLDPRPAPRLAWVPTRANDPQPLHTNDP